MDLKSTSGLSIGALSKTLILIKRTLGKNQDSDQNIKLAEFFDLSNKSDLKLFLLIMKKTNKSKHEEQVVFNTLKKFPFFEKIDPKVSSSLLQGFSQYFEYLYKSAGATIYESGEEGDYLYIILSGMVYILISKSGLMPLEYQKESSLESPKSGNKEEISKSPTINEIEITEKSSPKHLKLNLVGKRGSFFFKTSGFESMSQEIERRSSPSKKPENFTQRVLKVINIKYPEYNIAQELKSGESFGEVALITNSKRNEVCVCKENSHFLRINKKNYKKILMLNHAREMRELSDFFANFEIFSHWPRSQLSTFLKLFEMNVFNNNDVLFKENDESTFIYFIKEGEVEISKLVSCEGNEEKLIQNFGNMTKLSVFDIKRYKLYNTHWQESLQRKNFKRAKLAILGPGCYFGEEEFLANTLRNTKAVVKARSVIYFIKNEIFSSNVKTKVTMDKIKDECILKENWRKKLIKKTINEEKQKNKKISIFQPKAISLHSNPSNPLETTDFQDRTPFESRFFLKAKKHVLQKRKEIMENHNKTPEKNINPSVVEKLVRNRFKNKRPTFKLDLSKILNHETLQSLAKMPHSLHSEVKGSKTSRFSYLYHEDELSSKFNTTRFAVNENKISFEKALKSDDSRGVSASLKTKFDRALEKIREKKESTHTSVKSTEMTNGLTKSRLEKFIKLMFQDNKNKNGQKDIGISKIQKTELNEKNSKKLKLAFSRQNNSQLNEKNSKKLKLAFYRQSNSQLYLYNNSFQECNKTFKEETKNDHEGKCLNIHVEKKKKKLLLRNNSYFKTAMAIYKKARVKGDSFQ